MIIRFISIDMRARPITSHVSSAHMVVAHYLHQITQHWMASYTANPILHSSTRTKEATTILSSLHQWSVQHLQFQKHKHSSVFVVKWLSFVWRCFFPTYDHSTLPGGRLPILALLYYIAHQYWACCVLVCKRVTILSAVLT